MNRNWLGRLRDRGASTPEPSSVPTEETTIAPDEARTEVEESETSTGEPVRLFGSQYRIKIDQADVIAERFGPSGIGRTVGGNGTDRFRRRRDAMVRSRGYGEVLFGDD
ncbi:hypothetical protein MSTE_01811 [Mycobacteroides stephanolepidis]|uniref:Uncharacterized protein n=1 Tax=[Mycobacterium] stephanolepidis TaxID=1520670 RepID=A0A1Z4EVZ7_9MYCO|nr:hypothetical protein [[Mycobacterium] stephanolepidis]BAX97128.1 hypothetical protein MSTE_01811 [[Mycobacterium] stephanolepidis]